MKCSQCGHENKQGAKFCQDCGTKLGSSLCPKCGHKNKPSAQFCEECGAKMKGGIIKTTTRAAVPPAAATAVRTGLSTGIKIAIGIFSTLLIAGGAIFFLREYIDLPFLNFSGKSDEPASEGIEYTKVTYTTNPATVVDEGKPIQMVFDWTASTEEQVQSFIDSSEQEVMVNDTAVIAKLTYGKILEDLATGGFKTQVTTVIGELPGGENDVKTTIQFRAQVTDGKEWYGPGTNHEKVEKHAKVHVKSSSPAPIKPAGSCPSESEVYAGELVWDGDTPIVPVYNTNGWEPYTEAPASPPIFSSGGFMWAYPKCAVDPDDTKTMYCLGEFDQPAPNKEQIGLYLPYPWSKATDKYCVFEDQNLKIAEPAVECPPDEDIETGEVYWESGMAILEIENSNGWEAYKPMPDNGSFLAVNDEHYTDLGCDVDSDDNTILVCSGPGTIKTGGLGLLLTFPVGDQFCAFADEEVGIKNLCNENQQFCVFTGACCPASYQCDINGCHGESHDSHDH